MKKILIYISLLSSIILHSSESIPTQLEVAKLYIATFNRAPDSSGLDYWTTQSNFTLSQIAQSFFDQEETRRLYPSTISNAQFIELTYQNLFNRTPDVEGAKYWEAYLMREPDAKSLFIQTLINGAVGDDSIVLRNKTLTGLIFVDANLDDIELSHIVMRGITADINSVQFVQNRIDQGILTAEMWKKYNASEVYHVTASPYLSETNATDTNKLTTDTTWQFQMTGTLNESYPVALYDIDLFDRSTDSIKRLQASGKKVICYFSAGTREEWRADASQFPSDAIGNDVSGWAGEAWLDIRSQAVKDIMVARMDIARQKGCDGVDADNVNGYDNISGFDLTAQDQLRYNQYLATQAHKRGLLIGLKNDLYQATALEPYFDFSITERCQEYNNCQYYQAFIDANKPLLNIEYNASYVDDPTAREQLCQEAKSMNVRTIILPHLADDTFRYSCD